MSEQTSVKPDMSVIQVAERMQVARAVVYDLIHAGRLKAYRTNGKRGYLRIEESALNEFRKQNIVTPKGKRSKKDMLDEVFAQ
ncbi:DNA-binding protein [Corallincola luteus]|uniref:DNA-binding protein n=1 Tax=Corallincola luteus TaxID=1775177 RepID=A0ABY2ASJ4_9GAMM|nr:helix-turn-helix domain-containing protein [Corallincola luteus]TCI05032.1 DNA-binding protein [Corallincola luteus]